MPAGRKSNDKRKPHMKAMVWTRYGPPDALRLRDVEKPVPKGGQVLVRICAATVSAGDCEMRRLEFSPLLRLAVRLYAGLLRPRRMTILGQELAGEVEAVGKDAKRFKEGDHVFGALGFGFGAYAEYICLPEESEDHVLAVRPGNITCEEAAAVPVGGLNALYFLRKASIQSGQKVLINGAAGSIGTIAVQLAKSHGAHVTAVDSSGKLDMLRSIGADRVVDYTREDFTTSGEVYDVIFDVVGKASFSGCMRSLTKNGVYLLGNPSLSRRIRGAWVSLATGKRVPAGTASYRTVDLADLAHLIQAGKIRPVVDKRYPLEQIAEAHRYVESGHKRGNVVVTVAHGRD